MPRFVARWSIPLTASALVVSCQTAEVGESGETAACCPCPDVSPVDADVTESGPDATWTPLTCDDWLGTYQPNFFYHVGRYLPAGIGVSPDKRFVYYRVDYYPQIAMAFGGFENAFSLLYRLDLETLSSELATYWHGAAHLGCPSVLWGYQRGSDWHERDWPGALGQCITLERGRFRIRLHPNSDCSSYACRTWDAFDECGRDSLGYDDRTIGDVTDAARGATAPLRVFLPPGVHPLDDPPCSAPGTPCRMCPRGDVDCCDPCAGRTEDGSRYCTPWRVP